MGARESLVDKVEPLIMQNLKRGVGGRGGGAKRCTNYGYVKMVIFF